MQDTNDTIAVLSPARRASAGRSLNFSVERLLQAVRQGWRSSLLVFLAFFVPMLVVALYQPVLHRAEVKILLENDRRINLELSTALASKERERVLPIEKVNSQAEVLKSSTLLLDLVRELDLAQTAEEEVEEVKRLQKEIEIRVIPTSSVISISYEHRDPKRARDVVNALAAIYQRYYLRLIEGEDPVDLYQSQYDFSDSALSEDMKSLRDLQTELGIVSRYEPERTRLAGRLTDLRTQLERVGLTLGKSEKRAAMLRQQMAQEPETVRLSTETVPNPQAMELSNELSRLKSERDALLTRYTAKHSQVVRKGSEIAALDSRLRQIPRYITGESNYVSNPRYEKLHEELSQAEIEIGQLRIERDQLQADISVTEDQLSRLEQNAFRLTSLEDSVDGNAKARRLYHDKLVDARLVDTMNRENILSAAIIEDAVGSAPSDNRAETIVASFALSLLLAAGFVLVRDWQQPRLRSAEDLRALLGVPVLATISDSSRGRPLLRHNAERTAG